MQLSPRDQHGFDVVRTGAILVREAQPGADFDPQRAITDFNETGTASLTQSERAVAGSKRVSTRTLDAVTRSIEDLGDKGTLSAALDQQGPAIIESLIADQVLNPGEKATLISEQGRLTPEAKNRISKLVLGRVFRDVQQFDRTPPSIRKNLERSLPHIVRVEGRADWELTGDVQGALDMLEAGRGTGTKNLNDLARQQTIGGKGPEITPRHLAIARTIQSGPIKASRAFRQYANEAELSSPTGTVTLFEPPSAGESFEAAFGPLRDPQRGGVRLGLLTLGADRALVEDILPAARDAAAALHGAADDLAKIFAPTARAPEAAKAALILRERLARISHQGGRKRAAGCGLKHLWTKR